MGRCSCSLRICCFQRRNDYSALLVCASAEYEFCGKEEKNDVEIGLEEHH